MDNKYLCPEVTGNQMIKGPGPPRFENLPKSWDCIPNRLFFSLNSNELTLAQPVTEFHLS